MTESKHHSVFRNVLSLSKRVQVIKEYESYYPKPNILTLANKFNVGCSQIRNILFNQDAILKAYEEANKTIKKVSPDKSKTKLQENPNTVEDGNDLGMLSVTDRTKVVYDYSYQNPKPTINSLSTKYGVSSQLISNVLLSQDSVVEPQKKAGKGLTEEDRMERHVQRQNQIQFLSMVMYEYLQRALYYNVHLDNLQFQKKAAEVKECIALTNFRPSYLWLSGFKKKYGINDLSLESLRTEIIFTDEKENSLDAVDMVRFVRQNKSALLKSESKLINQITKSKLAKDLYSSSYVVGRRRKRTKYTIQLGENNEPEIVYKRDDDEILNALAGPITQTNSSDIASYGLQIELEISPAQLNEYTDPQPSTNKTLNPCLKTLERHFKKSDISSITVLERKLKAGKVRNKRDQSQNMGGNMISSLLSEEDEFLTIFQIVDDEAQTNPAAYNNQCSSPPLTNIDNNCPKPDLTGNTIDNIVIKTEPELFDSNDREQMSTIDTQSSTCIVPNHSQQVCLSATNCGDMIIRTESSAIELREYIKPTICFEKSEEFIMENNGGFNDNCRLPRLTIGKRSRSNSPLPNVLDEDIKPKIIYESGEEFLMESIKSPNDQQLSMLLLTDKQPLLESTPLPHVFDDDIKPTIVFEKSEEFIAENNNGDNDHHRSPRLASAKLSRFDSPLPDIGTPEEAMKLLKVLENYALLSDNYRAIGLLTHLEEAFKESPMQ